MKNCVSFLNIEHQKPVSTYKHRPAKPVSLSNIEHKNCVSLPNTEQQKPVSAYKHRPAETCVSLPTIEHKKASISLANINQQITNVLYHV
jgi:hypothetical protein